MQLQVSNFIEITSSQIGQDQDYFFISSFFTGDKYLVKWALAYIILSQKVDIPITAKYFWSWSTSSCGFEGKLNFQLQSLSQVSLYEIW